MSSSTVDTTPKETSAHAPASSGSFEEDEFPQVKLNTYKLGVNLEDMTAAIFQRMGYSVEKRKRVPTVSGATAEIDILARRGTRVKAIECKNYDESRCVGISDLRVFNSKLQDTKIYSGLFVTNTSYSEDSEKFAESTGMDRWDGDILREKYFTYQLGRIKNPSLVQDPVLPLEASFEDASRVVLRNNQQVRLSNSTLIYHPYIQVKYRMQAKRLDGNKKSHSFRDEGAYFVDALDGDIVNKERSVAQSFGTLFKKKEEKLQSRENKMVAEDLESKTPVTRPVLPTSDYNVSVAEPEVKESEAVKIVQGHVINKNTKTVRYEMKVKGEVVTKSFDFVPKMKETSVRGTKLVYVPKWDLEFESLQHDYSRRILASSNRVLVDDLAKCSQCTMLMKKSSAVVCEECGKLLCDKHAYQEGRWLCVDHISDEMREQVQGKKILPRLLKWGS